MGDNNSNGRRNKRHTPRHLVNRLALEVIQEQKFQGPYDYNEMYQTGFDACREKVRGMRVETQGLILSYGAQYGGNSGRTTMFDVHGTGAFNRHAGGKEILVQGAATVVMAVVMDILNQPARPTERLILRLESGGANRRPGQPTTPPR